MNPRRFAVTLSCSEAARLTERHLVDEAEVALHHLGPDQLRGRIRGDPVEAVGPRRVTEESRVIGGRSLKQDVFNAFLWRYTNMNILADINIAVVTDNQYLQIINLFRPPLL